MRRLAQITMAAAMVSGPAIAAEYPETVQSPVFESAGDHMMLAKRAATCLAQNTGLSGQAIQSDLDGGTVVGASLFSYSQGGIPWSVRSTLTVEAKDGRFRLTHTNLTQKQGGPAVASGWSIFNGSVDHSSEGEWIRVGRWRFSGSDKVEAAAQALSLRVATCIQTLHAENW